MMIIQETPGTLGILGILEIVIVEKDLKERSVLKRERKIILTKMIILMKNFIDL